MDSRIHLKQNYLHSLENEVYPANSKKKKLTNASAPKLPKIYIFLETIRKKREEKYP